jgi:hypothetical protein
MSFELYNLAEMIILSRWAENVAKCLDDKEKEEKYKKYKDTLMERESYKSVTIGMILLAAEELEGMNNEEIMDAVDTMCARDAQPEADPWIIVAEPST